jgi:polysaccharide export outer membrane protein
MTKRSGILGAGIAAVLLLALACLGQQIPQANLASSGVNSGQRSAEPSGDNDKAGSQSGFSPRSPRYELRPDDVLSLSFEFSPEFNQTVTVQPDGYITLHGVGDLYAAGKTLPQATDAIRKAYATILYEPFIAVVLKEFEKPYFIAGGQVAHPGKYDLRGDTTVTQAIAIAGGFNQTSKHSQVVLFRRVSDDWAEARMLNVKKMLGAKNLREDLHLQAGDMIFVPQNTMSKIERFLPVPRTTLYFNPNQF